jgi:DTW domain-containing protein YfiP
MTPMPAAPHAVSRLRTARLARSSKPFLARGGSRVERCSGCRLAPSHCMCNLRPQVRVRAGVCLIMADIEPLKPSNTGWLIADVVADTFAFSWARTEVDTALLAVLADPQWKPYLVFPSEFVDEARVVPDIAAINSNVNGATRRPLFVLLDGTWAEARKMFRKSSYLDQLPVLSLKPEQLSRYRLRRSQREEHLCTAEVAALCLELAGEPHAAQTLEAYLDVFTNRYLQARNQQPVNVEDAAHQRLRTLALTRSGQVSMGELQRTPP